MCQPPPIAQTVSERPARRDGHVLEEGLVTTGPVESVVVVRVRVVSVGTGDSQRPRDPRGTTEGLEPKTLNVKTRKPETLDETQ